MVPGEPYGMSVPVGWPCPVSVSFSLIYTIPHEDLEFMR
jgi:hypothetical protein